MHTHFSPLKLLLGLMLAASLCSTAHAALYDRGGGLIYDDVLNITWLANADLAASQTFGVSGISTNGAMNWATAQTWITAMNTANYLGYSNWRLPQNLPVNGTSYNYAYSPNGSSDEGYNITSPQSELAYMYYVNLGNKGFVDPSGNPQAGFGLVDDPANPNDESLFINLQSSRYWSGTELSADTSQAWTFDTSTGRQTGNFKSDNWMAWAVRPGDVATVPEPETLGLMLSGLVLVGAMARRRSKRLA